MRLKHTTSHRRGLLPPESFRVNFSELRVKQAAPPPSAAPPLSARGSSGGGSGNSPYSRVLSRGKSGGRRGVGDRSARGGGDTNGGGDPFAAANAAHLSRLEQKLCALATRKRRPRHPDRYSCRGEDDGGRANRAIRRCARATREAAAGHWQ